MNIRSVVFKYIVNTQTDGCSRALCFIMRIYFIFGSDIYNDWHKKRYTIRMQNEVKSAKDSN